MILFVLLQALLVLLAADLASGFVHWAEDTFFAIDTPFVGAAIIAPNEQHHTYPAALLAKSWFESSWLLMLAATGIVGAAWALGIATWHVLVWAALVGNANQIHKWAHLPRRKVPLVARWLQRIGALQSQKEHGRHHRGAKNTHYCTVTDWLNPLLERLALWRRLERITVPLLGAPRRADLVHLARRPERNAA